MARKRHKPEEIVAKLRQVQVLTAQGRSVAEVIRSMLLRFSALANFAASAASLRRRRHPLAARLWRATRASSSVLV